MISIVNPVPTSERMNENMSAAENPVTVSQSLYLSMRYTMRTLITTEISQRLSTSGGRVSNFKSGLIPTLMRANMTATKMAVKSPSTWIPGVMYTPIITTIPEMRMFSQFRIQSGVNIRRSIVLPSLLK